MATSLDLASDGLPHALCIPFPVRGQVNPMMHFAQTLTHHYQHLHITFINNYFHHTLLAAKTRCAQDPGPMEEAPRSPAAAADREDLDRRGFSEEFVLQPNIGSVCVDNGLPHDFDFLNISKTDDKLVMFMESCYTMSKNIGLFIEHRESKSEGAQQWSGKFSFIVVGTFCDWAINAVADLGIPIVYFSTQSAIVLSIYLHIPDLTSHGFFSEGTRFAKEQNPELSEHDGEDQLVAYIPGMPPLPPSSFPTYIQVHDPSDRSVKFIETQAQKMMLCKAIVINTFEELEGDACRALEEEFHIPAHPIGPMLPLHTPKMIEDEHGCIPWLDKKPKHSVVYISFGSIWNPSLELIKRLAEGIKGSKQPYLWALRPSTFWPSDDVNDILPENFLKETDGLIIPWAPQIDILAHSSVGAFLTHCGWNSTLESMSMGVPMIPIPFKSDQVTNCKLVVDIWKVGMNVKCVHHLDEPIVDSDDVERAVRLLMQENGGHEIRARAQKFKEIAKRATQCGGTSYAHIQKLIQMLRNNPQR